MHSLVVMNIEDVFHMTVYIRPIYRATLNIVRYKTKSQGIM